MRQRLVVYGPEPDIYMSAYNDQQAENAIKACCARYGRTCAARVVDGVTLALKQGLHPVVGK